MRRLLLLSLSVTGLVAHASAGGFERIDPNKRADVTGQTVDFPTVTFDSIQSPTRGQPVVPVGAQTVDRSQIVGTKTVTAPTVNFTKREFAVLPFKTEPQKNFVAKRADLNPPPVENPDVPPRSAKIPPRVLHPNTPAGAQELQDQINRIP